MNVGTKLGSYEILSAIGAGGMGEVYRARDTRLNRDVALKILPAEFAADPDRLARFKREAQVLASVNHPNIAAIYGFEDDGVHALVLELIEGPTLADRIAQGPILVDEALAIAKQIAEALEAAHEQGIIHRDLKPANIKVRPDGAVKVLDFGLAKALEPAVSVAAGMTNSPTLSMQATYAGVILGTAAYMSPEQASGKAVDKRSDIWSFGVVLWEMLTGTSLFAAETISHTLADVLRAPIAFDQLPPDTSPAIRDLLRRCLDRDVKRRLRDIGEARVTIERSIADPLAGTPPAVAAVAPSARSRWRSAVILIAGATLGAALSGVIAVRFRPAAPSPIVTRFTIKLPEGQQFPLSDRRIVEVSPDGTQLLYVASRRLYRKAMWEAEAQPITLAENPLGLGGQAPAFSPDGRSIAFVTGIPAGVAIQKIPLGGGTPATLATMFATPFGITWTPDGILFGQGGQGIQRVSENGGTSDLLVSVKAGETATYPQLLPGLDAVLYTHGHADVVNSADGEVTVRSLKSGSERTVIRTGSDARYVPTGHLVYAVGGVLFAVPFDLQSLQTTGEPVAVVEGVRRGAVGVSRLAQFSVSNTGVLAYVPGPASLAQAQRDVAFIDRSGKIQPLNLPAALYEAPRLSPNGKQIAVGSVADKESVIWIYDVSGSTSIRRLTFGGRNRFPIWSPDGERVAFQSDLEGDLAIFSLRADGTGKPERLTKPEKGASHVPDSWSGDRLLFSQTKDAEVSSWILSVTERKATPFSDIRSSLPINAAFSPDGKWVTYQLGRAGDNAVYVQPFPATSAKYQISKGLAHHPVWSRDGREIVYLPAQSLPLVARINTQPSFAVGSTQVELPVKGSESGPASIRNYDIAPDGRLVGILAGQQLSSGVTPPQEIRVVLNWFEELKQKVPVK
jgi:serine/threonine-protein kinase